MKRHWSARLIAAVLMIALAPVVVGAIPALGSGHDGGSLHIQLRGGVDERSPSLNLAALTGDDGAKTTTEARQLNDLALLYQNQGRYADAEPLYQRSLAMLQRTLGPNHPAVAATLGNLAALYEEEGRYAEAEGLCHRSVEILERALGPDHLALAVGLRNLALVYEHQSRDSDAEPLYRRALGILEQHLPPEHVGTDSII